jgi:hypothetical protein
MFYMLPSISKTSCTCLHMSQFTCKWREVKWSEERGGDYINCSKIAPTSSSPIQLIPTWTMAFPIVIFINCVYSYIIFRHETQVKHMMKVSVEQSSMVSLQFATCLVPWPDYNYHSFQYASPILLWRILRSGLAQQ